MASPRLRTLLRNLGRWMRGSRSILPNVLADSTQLDLRIVGRMVFQAAFVGVAAGLLGAAFFASLEYAQRFLLEDLAGYVPLRAHGELFGRSPHDALAFRPWLFVLLPALGGLACGLVARLVPEVKGGGADATIEAFHRRGGIIRRRVIWAKALASLFTLGTGGSGGREGPTMHIGGAIGSFVARLLRLSTRERRILLVAGVAAGIAAVFRTPLGAALLAVEMLYKDGFESDALIPSVLASVSAYSVVILIFGESTLFTHSQRFPFVPAHLPLYAVLALLVAAVAIAFVTVYRTSRRLFSRLPGPEWIRPGVGGLALGLMVLPLLFMVAGRTGKAGMGLGLLGGGYGAVQAAISGAPFLPEGWYAVGLLAALTAMKLVASSLTIGSGGSAGDFAPSLAIGGLFGGAFGRAAALMLNDPRIDPGAFALVGMGAFYGGIAHVPLASLVLVCEMAGNYDLLVPLMLALGISYVALRRHGIYEAQVATLRQSPAHRDALLLDLLRAVKVSDLMPPVRPFVTFTPDTPAAVVIQGVAEASWQNVFPVLDAEGRMTGLVSAESTHVIAPSSEDMRWMIAADLAQPPVWVRPSDDLRTATERLVDNGLRQLPVIDENNRVVSFLDEAEIARTYLSSAERAEQSIGPGRGLYSG